MNGYECSIERETFEKILARIAQNTRCRAHESGSGLREGRAVKQGLADGAPRRHRHRNELPPILIVEVILAVERGGQQVRMKAVLRGCLIGKLQLPPCSRSTPNFPDKETVELARRTVTTCLSAAIGSIPIRQTCTSPTGPRVTTSSICSLRTRGGIPPFEPPADSLRENRVGNLEAARLLSVSSVTLLQRVRRGQIEAVHVSWERRNSLASEGMCLSIRASWNDLHLTSYPQQSTLASLAQLPHVLISLDAVLRRVGAHNEAPSSEAEERERATTNELSRIPVHPRCGAGMGFARRRTASRGRGRVGSSARESGSPHRPRANGRHGGERR